MAAFSNSDPVVHARKTGIRPALIAVALWGGFVLIAQWFGDVRLWGINHLAFLPMGFHWAFGAALAAGLLFVAFGQELTPTLVRKLRPSQALGGIACVAATGVLAYLLRARAPFLGDGVLRATEVSDGLNWFATEIIPTVAASAIMTFAPQQWGIDGYESLAAVSVCSAMLWMAGLWYLLPLAVGTTAPDQTDPRRSAIFWLATFGSVRLLAGYVESYALPFAAFSLWTLAANAYRKGTLSATWMIILWCIAILSHITAILLAPAMLYLLWTGSGAAASTGQTRRWRHLTTPLIAITLVGGFVGTAFWHQEIKGVAGAGHWMLPLWGQAPHDYGLLSVSHWLDGINHWVLLAPAFVLAAAAAAVMRVRVAAGTSFTRSGRTFWILAAGVPLLFACLLDPKLGWARDWDLYCLLSAPALVAAALWLDRISGAMRRAAVVVATLSAGLWLAFSVDGAAELLRVESLLRLDRSRSDYGHELLGQYYRKRGEWHSAIRHYEEALLVSEHTRYRLNLGMCHELLGNHAAAIDWYRSVAARDTINAQAYFRLGHLLNLAGRWDEAVPFARRALRLLPGDPDGEYSLGMALLRTGDAASALSHFENAVRRERRPHWLHGLGVCRMELGQFDSALVILEGALASYDDQAPLWLAVAEVHWRRGDTAETQRYLAGYNKLVESDQRDPLYDIMADSLARWVE